MRYRLQLVGTQQDALEAAEASMERVESLGFYAANHGHTEYVGEKAVEVMADLYLALTGEPWPGLDK